MANEMPVLNAGIHMKIAFTSAELNDTEEGIRGIVQSGKRDKNCYIEVLIHFYVLTVFPMSQPLRINCCKKLRSLS